MRTFIQEVCSEASRIVLDHFGRSPVLYSKATPTDVVTAADLASNQHYVARLRSEFPNDTILSEEGETCAIDTGSVWVVDPLDGTRNFATGTPLFGTMIAYVKDGVVRMCAISLPALQEMYVAVAGEGAFLNGERITCSKQGALAGSYGCTNANFDPSRQTWRSSIIRIVSEPTPIWMNAVGCVAVEAAWTAAGRRDWHFTPVKSVWDTSAPALLLQEAGCVVTDVHGAPWRYGAEGLLAANPILHAQLTDLIRG